jgi:SAM-dependent methyltransferase
LVAAFDADALVGYAVILRFDAADGRRVAWIAQLVVHPTYRRSRIATTIMFSAWQFSSFDVWGVITANPYAVRALETATRRPCRSDVIVANYGALLDDLRVRLGYLPGALDELDGKQVPSLDTNFPLDLSAMEEMRRGAARGDRPWNLGGLDDGHEWFAVTFRSQEPSVARGEYLNDLLEGLDYIWIRAYEGMTLDDDHAWHRHGAKEVAWVLEQTGVGPGARVLDAGAGDGRHAVEFANRGCAVFAVDVSERLLARARARAEDARVTVGLHQGDLRQDYEVPEGPFDLIVCLYDVIGSSADPGDDAVILRNLRLRQDDGYLVVSVMSAAATLPRLPPAHVVESDADFVRALEELRPSRDMEKTGGVFDPDRIVFFRGQYFRKEQFDQLADLPPSELIVRDRRFFPDEIAHLIREAGYEVVDLFGVRAGAWASPLDPSSEEAREILVVARAV